MMIEQILRINGARFYEVHTAQKIGNATTGSKGNKYAYSTQVFACIQPPGGNMIGLQATADAGDVQQADYVMYSKEERFEKERILYRGDFYEIRSVKYFDNNYLMYFRSYLVKVDNQPKKTGGQTNDQ